MKIVLHDSNGSFVWDTPPIIDIAKEAIEKHWQKQEPKRSEPEARQFIEEITEKIARFLFIIKAGTTLGGKEACQVFDRLDEALETVKDLAMGLGEQKFGGDE